MVEILIGIASTIGLVLLAIIALVVVIKSCWKVAGTNEVLIVSGLGKVPRLKTGGGIFVIPMLQKVQKMPLENIQVDFVSKADIPTQDAINVKVDAVANMSISQDPARQAIAASKFANYSINDLVKITLPVLEGSIREILSKTPFRDLIRGDKDAFSKLIQESVTPDLAAFGIDLTTFNIQSFSDNEGIIKDLGVENLEQIRKDAQIAAANAKAEVAVAQAEADKRANEAKVKAATEIAQQQTEFAIKKAELQKQADTEQAKADAAKKIEAENQRKAHEIAVANANLAKQEKEIELKEREVAIKERTLEAEIKKTAEAKKYAEQQEADARLYEIQRKAEAELFERERKAEAEKMEAEKQAEAELALATAKAEAEKKLAEAIKAKGLAEAEAEKARGLAEAEAIRAKAEAEAKGMLEKAEAMKQFQDAAMADMQLQAIKAYFEQLPAIAEAIGKGYAGADIHVIGNDSGQLAGNIMGNVTQLIEGFNGAGINLPAVFSGMLGAKIVENNE